MAKATKICKVCGKEYEYCKTWLSTDKFRWQDVACSPECGAKYFEMIEASRSGKKIEAKPEKKVEKVETKADQKKAEKKSVKKQDDVVEDILKDDKDLDW